MGRAVDNVALTFVGDFFGPRKLANFRWWALWPTEISLLPSVASVVR
jgi:hypothetical protein